MSERAPSPPHPLSSSLPQHPVGALESRLHEAQEALGERCDLTRMITAQRERCVYSALTPDGASALVLQVRAPLHLHGSFDPNATRPRHREPRLTLPLREHLTLGHHAYCIFEQPPGCPTSLGLRLTWDPDRVLLLSRIVRSFRRARDRRTFLPHAGWDTLFVDPLHQVSWASPALYGNPAPAASASPASVRVLGIQAAPSYMDNYGSEAAAADWPSEPHHLDEIYVRYLRELLPLLILRNFCGAPIDGEGLPGDGPLTPESLNLLPEEVPYHGAFLATPECRNFLAGIISGRVRGLDAVHDALERFGATRVVRTRHHWRSHRGCVREHNEDAVLVMEQASMVCSRASRTVLYGIADGMGGHEAGEIASEITLKALATEVLGAFNLTSPLEYGRRIHDHEYLADVTSAAMDRTNETLRYYTRYAHAGTRKQPGSTLVFAIASGPIITLGNVGDSRAYKLGPRGELERITRDHSPVQRMLDLCTITPEEAFVHPHKNQIFSNIGIAPEQLMKGVETRYLREGEGVLLCTDGLTDLLRDAEIEAITRENAGAVQKMTQALVEAACAAGGTDNVSVLVVVRTPVPLREERELPETVPDEVEEADA